jgi:hypothetical protein
MLHGAISLRPCSTSRSRSSLFKVTKVWQRFKGMATVHMTSNEVSNNCAAVIENIRKGLEVVVEQNHHAVALIRSPKHSGRPISECIAVTSGCAASLNRS